MPVRHVRTAVIGATVALVAAGALTGCAGRGPDASLAMQPVAAVRAALTSTTQTVSTAAFTATVTGGDQALSLSGKESLGSPTKAEVTATVAGQQVQVRTIGSAVYVNVGALAGVLGSKTWVKLDVSGNDATKALGLDSLLSSAQQDPRKALEMLVASGDLVAVGTETLGGEQVTHYSGSIDVTKALPDLPSDVRKQLDGLVTSSGITAVKVDAWVGSDHLPRRITEAMQSPAGPVTVDVAFSDYNAPVDIRTPPASQTSDLSALTTGLSGLGDALSGLLGS